MAHVGVVGAGLMGAAISGRLTQAGFDVWVYDVDAAKSAIVADAGRRQAFSVAELARQCATLVLAVFSTDQVEQVIEGAGGILDTAGDGTPPLIICTSTCDPDRLEALAGRGASRGLRLLEAPISGTSRQVAGGEAVGLIGGDRATMDDAATVLDAICRSCHYLGAVGNGSRAKLAVNLILGLNRAALAEGLVFGERLGLKREALLGVARASAAYSSVMDTKGRLMVEGRYLEPQSRVDQSLKDFNLMLSMANRVGQTLPFASVYATLLKECVEQGHAGWDNAAIVEAIASWRDRTDE